MPYGDFTDYAEDPTTGAVQFNRVNGPPITFTGAPAAELKQRIDMSNVPLAESGLPATVAAPDRIGTSTTGTPQQEVERAKAAAAEEQAATDAEASKPKPIASGKHGEEYLTAPDGTLLVHTRGSAGSKGGWTPTTESQKGGFDANQDYIEQQHEANLDLRLAKQSAYGAQMEAHAREQGALEANLQAQQVQAKEAHSRELQEDYGVAQKQAQYEQARDSYNKTHINSNPYSRDPVAIVSLLLGSMAANWPGAKRQMPNYAHEILQAKIDRDIRAQEAQIAIKKDASNTALGDLQRQLGSRELAREAYRKIQLENSQTKINLAAAQAKGPEEAAKYQEWAALNMKDLSESDEKYRQLSLGEVTKNTKYNAPVAASRPGLRRATFEEEKQALELQNLRNKGEPGNLSDKQKAEYAKTDVAISELGKLKSVSDTAGFRITGTSDEQEQTDAHADAAARAYLSATGVKPTEASVKALKENFTKRKADDRAVQIQTKIDELEAHRKAIAAGATTEPAADDNTEEKVEE